MRCGFRSCRGNYKRTCDDARRSELYAGTRVPRVDFQPVFRIAGIYGDEFDTGWGVGHDAVYFHRFGGVLHGNHPESAFGREAFDFNSVAHNLAYMARLKKIAAL